MHSPPAEHFCKLTLQTRFFRNSIDGQNQHNVNVISWTVHPISKYRDKIISNANMTTRMYEKKLVEAAEKRPFSDPKMKRK